MITVHHLETSRSQRSLALGRIGLALPAQGLPTRQAHRLAPPELKQIHPLGKSPVITDGQIVVAESGAIIEYLVETHAPGHWRAGPPRARCGHASPPPMPVLDALRRRFADELAGREAGVRQHSQTAMPFFVRPVAKALCATVQSKLIDPNVDTALTSWKTTWPPTTGSRASTSPFG